MSLNITIIALRLLGIYCFLYSLESFQHLPYVFTSEDNQMLPMMLTSMVPGGVVVLCGIILFAFARPLAMRLANDLFDEEPVTVEIEQLQPMLIAVVGVLVFALAVRPTFLTAAQLVSLSKDNTMVSAVSPKRVRDTWYILAGGLLQLFVGGAIFFKARSISRFWNNKK